MNLEESNLILEKKLKVIKEQTNYEAVESINKVFLEFMYSNNNDFNAVEVKTKIKFIGNKRYKHLQGSGIIHKQRLSLKDFLKTALNRKTLPETIEYTFYKGKVDVIEEAPPKYNFLYNNLSMEYPDFLLMNLNESEEIPKEKALFFAEEITSIKITKIDEDMFTRNLKTKWDDQTGFEYYLE